MNLYKRLLQVALLLLTATAYSAAQGVPVVLAPVPQLQFFDANGNPLAFGCVFSYRSATNIALATYSDYTGTIQNANPVPLNSSGSANIWLQAGQAYTLLVKSTGGTDCSLGTLMYSVDGIGGGAAQLTTSNSTATGSTTFVDQSQNQLFIVTLIGNVVSSPLSAVGVIPPGFVTWQITQDNVGSHTFSWPANVTGGCTIASAANVTTQQVFIWNGTTAIATGPCVTGSGPSLIGGNLTAAAIIANTSVTSPYFASSTANASATGNLRLANIDSIKFRNNANNADYGISADPTDRGHASYPAGFVLDGATPSLFVGGTTASFPMLKRTATAVNFRLGDDSADAPITASTLGLTAPATSTSATHDWLGTEVATPGANPSAGTQKAYPKAGAGWCSLDSAGVEYCPAPTTRKQVKAIVNVASCALAANGGEWNCTGTITWGVTLSGTTYYAECAMSTPQPGGSFAIPAGYQAKFFTGTKSTTTMGYTIDDDHSGSNGAVYNLSCVAIE